MIDAVGSFFDSVASIRFGPLLLDASTYTHVWDSGLAGPEGDREVGRIRDDEGLVERARALSTAGQRVLLGITGLDYACPRGGEHLARVGGALLPGADADDAVHGGDPHLPVTDLAGRQLTLRQRARVASLSALP